MQRMTCVDDILDHQHVAAFYRAAQVLEDAHLTRGFHAVAVAGSFEEIDLDRQVQFPHEIGDEHEGSSEQPHHYQLVGAVEFIVNCPRKRLYPCGNRLGGNHFIDHIGRVRHGFALEVMALIGETGLTRAATDSNANPFRDPRPPL